MHESGGVGSGEKPMTEEEFRNRLSRRRTESPEGAGSPGGFGEAAERARARREGAPVGEDAERRRGGMRIDRERAAEAGGRVLGEGVGGSRPERRSVLRMSDEAPARPETGRRSVLRGGEAPSEGRRAPESRSVLRSSETPAGERRPERRSVLRTGEETSGRHEARTAPVSRPETAGEAGETRRAREERIKESYFQKHPKLRNTLIAVVAVNIIAIAGYVGYQAAGRNKTPAEYVGPDKKIEESDRFGIAGQSEAPVVITEAPTATPAPDVEAQYYEAGDEEEAEDEAEADEEVENAGEVAEADGSGTGVAEAGIPGAPAEADNGGEAAGIGEAVAEEVDTRERIQENGVEFIVTGQKEIEGIGTVRLFEYHGGPAKANMTFYEEGKRKEYAFGASFESDTLSGRVEELQMSWTQPEKFAAMIFAGNFEEAMGIPEFKNIDDVNAYADMLAGLPADEYDAVINKGLGLAMDKIQSGVTERDCTVALDLRDKTGNKHESEGDSDPELFAQRRGNNHALQVMFYDGEGEKVFGGRDNDAVAIIVSALPKSDRAKIRNPGGIYYNLGESEAMAREAGVKGQNNGGLGGDLELKSGQSNPQNTPETTPPPAETTPPPAETTPPPAETTPPPAETTPPPAETTPPPAETTPPPAETTPPPAETTPPPETTTPPTAPPTAPPTETPTTAPKDGDNEERITTEITDQNEGGGKVEQSDNPGPVTTEREIPAGWSYETQNGDATITDDTIYVHTADTSVGKGDNDESRELTPEEKAEVDELNALIGGGQ